MKKKKKRKLKEHSDNWWRKKAWKVFSVWVRLRDSDKLGFIQCCSCGSKVHWKRSHAGHFVSGRTNSILFDEKNTHAQCARCNIFLSGNWPGYYEFMIKTYGIETINNLLAQKKQERKMYRSDYQDIIDIHTVENGLLEKWNK